MRERAWVIVAVLAVGIAVVAGLSLGSRSQPRRAAVLAVGRQTTGSVSVDALATSPEHYLGRQVVSGNVTSVDAAKDMLVLGCADACVVLPVQFSGSLPKVGAEVVVTGTVDKKGGRYAFVASKVEEK